MEQIILHNLEILGKEYPSIEYLSVIKSGKEAEVHLVRDNDDLMALKVYKSHQKYSSRANYIQSWELGSGQVQRAVKNRTRAGKRMIADIWASREFRLLQKLHKLGADIPEPLMLGHNAILMEYIGDSRVAAPRLVDVLLSEQDAQEALEVILENIWLMLSLNYVHGDLSAYNILFWEDQIYIIDFPQVLDVHHNKNAKQKLIHDLDQVDAYFDKYGIRIPLEERIKLERFILI